MKARPDSIDPETVAAMKALGVVRVFLGVESNAINGLKSLGRGIRREQNHAALKLLRGAGMHVTFNLLMFEPECTPDDLQDNIDFIRAWAELPLNFCRVEVYGGTPLEADLRKRGRLVRDYFGFDYHLTNRASEDACRLFHAAFRHASSIFQERIRGRWRWITAFIC